LAIGDDLDRGGRIVFEANPARLLHVEFALDAAPVRADLHKVADQLLHAGKIRADLVDLCTLRWAKRSRVVQVKQRPQSGRQS
jgi:hypothetical protein